MRERKPIDNKVHKDGQKMSKTEILKGIAELIKELNSINGDGNENGYAFFGADLYDGSNHIQFIGNMAVLSMGFGSHMEYNETFHKIFFALFQSYLKQNPDEIQRLISALEISSYAEQN